MEEIIKLAVAAACGGATVYILSAVGVIRYKK